MRHEPRILRPLRWERARWVLVIGLGLAGPGLPGSAAKVETWRQEGAGAFAKAHRESVVLSDNGRARLGHAIEPFGSCAAERVWDLARLSAGTLFAATGDAGKVFRRDRTPDAPWTIAYDSGDTQALSLAVCPDGSVFVGTGPTGQVVNLTDPAHHASRPDPKVQYIWGLAADRDGNLHAATGPNGQLWKRSRDGKWSLLYKSKSTHLLSVAIGPDGAAYVGTDGEGLVYRVPEAGKATVLFDAPQSEVRKLLWAGDGALYAGTAAEAGGGSSTRSSIFLTQDGRPQSFEVTRERGGAALPIGAVVPGTVPTFQEQPVELAQARPAPPRPAPGGSATPRPVAAGDNAVYRLEADGVPREVLRVKALVHALAWVDSRLLVGTGPEGQLYEVRDHGHETVPVAKLDHGQILSLLPDTDGGVIMGTGDPGSVVRLSPEYAAAGRLVSEVFDTKLISHFGALAWKVDQPPGTKATLQCRSGNVAEPDETWSSWSPEQSDPDQASCLAPAGRFIQYRANLVTTDPRRTPELRSIALSYRTANLAPELPRLDVPDLSAADGTVRQTRLNLRWDASDPNDDELSFLLKVRKEGWPDWIGLFEAPITEKSFTWDTTAFPSGMYRLRLIASDRPSNGPSEALSRERDSVSFIVDHEPPKVSVTAKGRGAMIRLKDELTRLVKADYALDGAPWVPIFPDDGLFDSLREEITLPLPDLKAGVHLLMVRATDAAGNVGNGDALIEVRN
jgi:hypothetical protein